MKKTKNREKSLPPWVLDTPHPRWSAAIELHRIDWCVDLFWSGLLLLLRSMSHAEQLAFADYCCTNPEEALDRILTAADKWLDAGKP
jgi:hypothetical protein